MPTWLSAAFTMIGQALGLINKRTDLKNAPDVRERAKAQSEVAQVDGAEAAVAGKKTEEVRDGLAE